MMQEFDLSTLCAAHCTLCWSDWRPGEPRYSIDKSISGAIDKSYTEVILMQRGIDYVFIMFATPSSAYQRILHTEGWENRESTYMVAVTKDSLCDPFIWTITDPKEFVSSVLKDRIAREKETTNA